ncbi:uncharacterized protein N7529_009079 [Penicillium soppii]|uniref:uncharacterized protein n=1 Tax=Penicillium soppii TaxID=69789 RepID=UPI002546CBF6|nr:uncharacterized protein N7529_009079 [Penicillium soppii]KAJ5861769.1 hypothetical protein N7529_009079 [Penicillium soppii]
MASVGAPLPFQDAKATASTVLSQVFHRRPRTQRTKAIALSVIALLCFLFMLRSSSKVSADRSLLHHVHTAIVNRADNPTQRANPDFWTKFPSRHPFPERPEDARVILPPRTDINVNHTLPHDLDKPNPRLHVLIPASQGSRGVCRTITSAMILGYPPPTLIGYGEDSPGATEAERMVDRITRARNYLRDSKTVHDRDFVLMVDGLDTYFQLPPQVLVERFQSIIRANNRKLRKKFGVVNVEGQKPGAPLERIQKYSQRVVFGASKICFPGLLDDPGCASVPESSLPPDVYGWKTDNYPDGSFNRPRWLNPGAVIGQAADLRLIYDEVLRQVGQRSNKAGDYKALTEMYGRQEVIRELERRRTVSVFKDWIYQMVGISDASNITGISLRLETGHRYEYGIGVDFESQLFFNQIMSRKDVEWVNFSNITKMSMLQMQHGVPREHRLLLPQDIAALPNPFNQSRFAKESTLRPVWNATLDKLPNPYEHSWHNVPLMTNPHSASVPVLAHLNGDAKLRNTWWENMWFFPWGRALLRKYVRGAHGFDTAQSSLLGGQDWLEVRGGRGGIWTDKEIWVTMHEVCNGQERDLFDDGLGLWAKENDDPDAPVYNQYGSLIAGKEDPNAKEDNLWF